MADEIWLVPHRDGMLHLAGRLTQVGPQESAIIELLSTRVGETVTPDDIAARVWPDRQPEQWPEDYLPLIQHRMVTVRKLLPVGYIATVYDRERKRFLLHGGRKRMIGWRLVGKINVHPA